MSIVHGWLGAGVLVATVLGCGARSSLEVDAQQGAGVAGSGGSAGHEPVAGSAGSTPTVPCVLQQVGRPAAAGFGGESTVSPSLSLVDPGDRASSRLARAAVQAVSPGSGSGEHSANLLVLHDVDRAWPTGLTVAQGALTMSEQSHGYGLTARSTAADPRIALVYPGDPGGAQGLRFRAIDADLWQPEPDSTIIEGGLTLGDWIAGSAVAGAPASYQGTGYALGYWQPETLPTDARAMVLVTDEAGIVVLWPLQLTAVLPGTLSPGWGRGPSLIWTGSTYLAAVVEPSMVDGGDFLLETIVVGAVQPNGTFLVTGSFPWLGSPGGESWSTGRPSLARVGEEIWLTWPEGFALAPEVVRLVRLAADGTVLAEPQSLSIPLLDSLRPVLAAGEGMGPTLSWVSEGNTSLPDGAFGRSFIVTQPLDDTGAATEARVEAPIFGPAQDYAAVVSTRYPHGLLATFAAVDQTYLHRLDCGDSLPDGTDGCLACPGAPPDEGAACTGSPAILCAFPSKTAYPWNLARCEAGAWRYHGEGTPDPLPGECPRQQPSGPCAINLECHYGTQGSWDYTSCHCSAVAEWSCLTQTVCE